MSGREAGLALGMFLLGFCGGVLYALVVLAR